MGYPTNLKAISRKIADNIVITSCAFSRFNKVKIGARMALIDHDDQIIVWSAIPYGDAVINALKMLKGEDKTSFNVRYLIIPDAEHTLAAKSFKKEYPEMKIIGMEGVDLGDVQIDYKVTASDGNKILNREFLSNLGITSSAILDNFEFVYLPTHKNKELIVFNSPSKVLFEADLFFNMAQNGLEQYSPETGFTNYSPSGWSYLTKYLNPDSKLGSHLAKKVLNVEKAKGGLNSILSWDFETIVMCHGNLIEKNAKEAFKRVFNL